MERDKFEALVEQALADLPAPFRERLTNVAIIVEDLPPPGMENQGTIAGPLSRHPAHRKERFLFHPP